MNTRVYDVANRRNTFDDGDTFPRVVILEDFIQERGVARIVGHAQEDLATVQVIQMPPSGL